VFRVALHLARGCGGPAGDRGDRDMKVAKRVSAALTQPGSSPSGAMLCGVLVCLLYDCSSNCSTFVAAGLCVC
jgi:hypothetical protein